MNRSSALCLIALCGFAAISGSGCTQTEKKLIRVNDPADATLPEEQKAKSMLQLRLEKNIALAEEFPEEPKYLERVASFYWQMGEHTQALDYLDRARDLDPKNPRYDYVEAQIYNSIGNVVDAERCYKELIEKIGDKFAGPDYELGWLYYNDSRYDLAEQHFRRCLEINSLMPGVHYSLGMVAFQTKNREEAIKSFEEYLRLGGGTKNREVTEYLEQLQPELRRIKF